ncbi:MAG TPA: tetratricopeptide repeat protein [Pyrinomonadaceae bacterium]|nr:tetratricopeptide repeat protein [Pyrinomonadaceae bacterium]
MQKRIIRLCFCISLLTVAWLGTAESVSSQGTGGNVLYGDVYVDEQKEGSTRLVRIEVTLYNLAATVLARQVVGNNGRYRFTNLAEGEYLVAVSIENSEVSRMRVQVRTGPYPIDIRQDINLGWTGPVGGSTKPASISIEDLYKRTSSNQKLFEKAQASTDKKKYEESIVHLKELLTNDPEDFQAWTELGTVFLMTKNPEEAEKAYERSISIRPAFFLALMDLGRLRLMEQKFDGAIPVLTKAVEVKPVSADANYYLGEAFLQLKKGSKAVGYFYEALKLDPVGKADAHLRLAALYNGAGLKDKAAAEYSEFLKKKPDYPDKKKLQEYITQNQKPKS